jgi:hypothetical protein
VIQIEGQEVLKTLSDTAFRVIQIHGADGHDYKVIEVADWFDLSMNILLNPGKIRKASGEKIGRFSGGLAAVKFCEDRVVKMCVDSLKEAHQSAISMTVRKFKLHPPQLP